jgi:hypothetical protein
LKSLIKKILRETTIITEGPICGDKTGDACGNCGDGYVWTDSYVTNSCICNHPQGAVCHSTGMYGDDGTLEIDDLFIPNKVKGYRGRPRLKESGPPGVVNITGTYKDVEPYYNFQSQGPMPGTLKGPGYDFESKGPEGVNYFMEEDGDEVNPWAICTSSLGLEGKKRKDYSQTEKDKYEKCVLSMKGKIKESNIRKIVKKVVNESKLLLNENVPCNPNGQNPQTHANCRSIGKACLGIYQGVGYFGVMGYSQAADLWDCIPPPGWFDNQTGGGNVHTKGLDDVIKGELEKLGGDRALDSLRLDKEQISESKHGGSYMAKKQLWGIADKAKDMAERLPDDTQLEDWMESHIAKADSMMDSVYDSFDYDNQRDIPGFEGTMDALNDLSIREQENLASTLYQQDTSHRRDDTGGVVASTQMLDIMDGKLDTLTDIVTDIQENLSRDWM